MSNPPHSFSAPLKGGDRAVNLLPSDPVAVSRIENFIRQWWPRFDTFDMAEMLDVPESDVANVFARLRDREHQGRAVA